MQTVQPFLRHLLRHFLAVRVALDILVHVSGRAHIVGVHLLGIGLLIARDDIAGHLEAGQTTQSEPQRAQCFCVNAH